MLPARAPGRHRAAPPPGPVTVAIRVITPKARPLDVALRAWPAVPALALARPALAGSPHLADYGGKVLGFDATLCLIACLTVTPLMAVARVKAAKLRWWYGIWMFALGAAGLALAFTGPGPGPAARAGGNAVNWTGLAIVVLLLPMTLTSNRAAQKLLGPEWKRWQRSLVWVVWAFTGLHLCLLRDWPSSIAFGMASVQLLALRQRRMRQAVKRWRTDGYSTGGMWMATMILAALFVAGVTFMLGEEAVAVARALALRPLAQ